MELEIQKWVRKTKPFMQESKELFYEAIECYKVGANRAAFIMSYLAFEKTIQERILNFGTIPNGITAEDFEKLKSDLQNHNEWEKAIYKCIIQKNQIMNLPNKSEIEKRLQVYKLTRNACTHANGQTVNDATVEEFWNFLKDNISKFNVNGGKEYFKEALYKSFRDRNENVEKTTEEILTSLIYANLKKDEIIEIIDYLYSKLYTIQDRFQMKEFKEFWNKIIYINDNNIKESLLNFIKSNSQCFSYFYKINPNILNLLLEYDDGVKFKKEILYIWISSGELYLSLENEYWNIIIMLLRNYVHERDRIDFIKKMRIGSITVIPNDNQTEYLKEINFFEINKNFILNNLTYDYDEVYNQIERIDFIVYMIKNGFDDDCMDNLNWYLYHMCTKSKYRATQQLFNILKETLLNDKTFVSKVKNCCKNRYLSKETKDIIDKSVEKLNL